MSRRMRRMWKPELLLLETRAGPTVISPLASAGSSPGQSHADRAQIRAAQAAAAAAAPVLGAGQEIDFGRPLSAIGLSQAAFVAKFNGPVGTGLGQYQDQGVQYLYTASGNATQFLIGRLVMRLFTPAATGGNATGLASIRDRNVATTGTNLILDIQGDASALDPNSRPSHLAWKVDPGSGGYYLNATGQGTLDIIYSASHRRVGSHTVHEAGSATAIFQGLIITNVGVTDPTVFELNKRL